MSDPLRRVVPLETRMREATRAAGKPRYVVEKDYALSHVLAGIGSVPVLKQSLVFKGGTCLRKIYFREYRFSEDLDFSLLGPVPVKELLVALETAADAAAEELEAHGPFTVTIDQAPHRNRHPGGQVDCRMRLRFPWMSTPDCSVKIEITTDEPVLETPVHRPLLHTFPGESLDVTIGAYAIHEIAAEKLRGFLQKREQLLRKKWTSNRPRDLFDLQYLWHQTELPVDWQEVRRVLPLKSQVRAVSYHGSEDFLDEQVLKGIQSDWTGQLSNFVSDLPSFEESLATLRRILAEVLG